MSNYYDVYRKLPDYCDEFFGQFLRTLGKSYSQCADIGECFVTLANIRDNDFESWYHAWFARARDVEQLADSSWEAKHYLTAATTCLRAVEYYRASEFFLRANLSDPRIIPCFDRLGGCFERAMQVLHPEATPVAIPYDRQTLSGYLFPAASPAKATLIIPGGYDSTFEEHYPLIPPAMQHRYNVLIFDGPGQGHVLRRQKLYMRPDFEHVVSQVLDWLDGLTNMSDRNYVLIGRSFGGYLAPRAACGEKRIKALVCDPAQMDIAASLDKLLPPALMTSFREGREREINEYFHTLFSQNKMTEFYFRSRMNTHGITTPFNYLREMTRYTLADRVTDILCPTLLCANPNDRISTRANTLYDALQCEKTYVEFRAESGAGMHCEADANGQFQRILFDWLNEHFST
ncbi:alpha/beta hydrolase family protein [Legionella spiritensis]|uniref:Dipeptidyl aminopeptidase/acylaminoacyl peptidase n=1 Tax=Legionella spiritensis TaxID=452 RepID=A0A0W0Z956_LEGSP|nr:alpha/beta fold hydrolase [Legionella spiritensis]KTD65666.1 dipeptidyl aminopeptidase/acylaminoacyl peptidase [Legionella spiritensis]SNV43648.1 dipeptidyl aminopeptidase/acylaminoacyl peptidase [Legionella spiritensis]